MNQNLPRRPSGISTGLVKRIGVVAIAVTLPALMWLLTPPPPAPATNAPGPELTISEQALFGQTILEQPASTPGLSPTPLPAGATSVPIAPTRGSETYAVALPALRGLPPEVPPGTTVKVWAAWEPPITKQPRIQVLIERAVVQAIIPATDPSAPPTVLLWVPAARIPDLLYGDRYGALSVTLPEPTS